MESHVIALPGCYLISTVNKSELIGILYWLCQCPLGLLPHFYSDNFWVALDELVACQCPLGLVPHFYKAGEYGMTGVIWRCQCPLGLLPHFYSTPSKT